MIPRRLKNRKDKFSFAISFHAKEVDTEDEKEEEENENRLCGIWIPRVADEVSFASSETHTIDYSLPPHGETPRRIQKPRGVVRKRPTDRKRNRQFPQRLHREKLHRAHCDKGNEQRYRTAAVQRHAGRDEKTGSDRTSEGNHLQVAVLELPGEGGVGRVVVGLAHVEEPPVGGVGGGVVAAHAVCILVRRRAAEALEQTVQRAR
ncbi:hypothetical protein HG530_010480 [Fusarium avenaceum]|nr:hypothetical protein HG530_010480 [Fusarium avenaceum]